jgi:hypothetical protein
MTQQATQTENSDLIMLNMIEAELKESKTFEGFKNRLNDIRTLIEAVAAVETDMQKEGRDLNYKEKAALSKIPNTP